MKDDTISRQAAIETTWEEPSFTDPFNVLTEVRDRLKALPPAHSDYDCVLKQFGDCTYDTTGCSDCVIKAKIKAALSAQPEITDEQAIEHLQSTGWMQNHDRILIQSTWDIIRCKDCKYGDTFHEFDEPDMPMKCLGQHYGGTYPDDFCSYAERRTDEGN